MAPGSVAAPKMSLTIDRDTHTIRLTREGTARTLDNLVDYARRRMTART